MSTAEKKPVCGYCKSSVVVVRVEGVKSKEIHEYIKRANAPGMYDVNIDKRVI